MRDAQVLSPDLKTLAARNYQEVQLWDLASGKVRLLLSEHRGSVCCLEYSADGATLLSASRRSKDYFTQYFAEVKQWDLASGRERASLNAKISSVSSLAPSPDGKTLALLDLEQPNGDIKLRVFDFPSGRERVTRKGKGHSFQSVTYRRNRLFVLGKEDRTAKLWEVVLPND